MLLNNSNNIILPIHDVPNNKLIQFFIQYQIEEMKKERPTYIIVSKEVLDLSITTRNILKKYNYDFNTIYDLNSDRVKQLLRILNRREFPEAIVINTTNGISELIENMYNSIAINDKFVYRKPVYRRPIVFFLDDFDTLPTIESMPQIMTSCLYHNISFNLFIQSYSQLKKIYGIEAKTILSNSNQILTIE